MQFIINPGTEAVPRATGKQAEKNIRRWAREAAAKLGGKRITLRKLGPSDEGRYPFFVKLECNGVQLGFTVLMPGIANIDGGPWVSPRLYVDGSSWLWEFSFPHAEEFSTTKE